MFKSLGVFFSVLSSIIICCIACNNTVCPPETCKNNGKIRKLDDSCFCECPKPYLGRFCDSLDLCAQLECQNGALCENGKCQCPEGFTGTDCSIPVDPCSKIQCANEGICVNGSCSCSDGFYGANCDSSKANTITGLYNLNESCLDGKSMQYQIVLDSNPNKANSVLLKGLANFSDATVSVTVGNSGIKIRNQSLAYYGFSLEGSGTLSGASFEANIVLVDKATDYIANCTWTAKRIRK